MRRKQLGLSVVLIFLVLYPLFQAFPILALLQNTAPVAVKDDYNTDEDVTLVVAAPGVLTNDSDFDNDPLTAILDSGPVHGSLMLNRDGDFTYTPIPNFHGMDSFTYKANDGSVDSNIATVTITVNPVNDPPVAGDDTATTDEDVSVIVDVLANDSDADGDTLTIDSCTQPADGSVTFTAAMVTYTPDANFHGTDTFTYTVIDGKGGIDTATVTITVNPVNDPPVAGDDAFTTDEDVTLVVAAPGVLGNDADADGDLLTAILDSGPAHGSLTLNPDGSFTYTPDAGYSGTDSFTYTANDGAADSNIATVTITVVQAGEGEVPLFSDALWILPMAILAGVCVVLRKRKQNTKET